MRWNVVLLLLFNMLFVMPRNCCESIIQKKVKRKSAKRRAGWYLKCNHGPHKYMWHIFVAVVVFLSSFFIFLFGAFLYPAFIFTSSSSHFYAARKYCIWIFSSHFHRIEFLLLCESKPKSSHYAENSSKCEERGKNNVAVWKVTLVRIYYTLFGGVMREGGGTGVCSANLILSNRFPFFVAVIKRYYLL